MKLHHKLAGIFGYELIKKRKLNDTLEQHLRNAFDLLAINGVIDVGANVGQYATMLRNFGYRGRIVSFEPLASAFAGLKEASRDDENWPTFNFAVGSEKATMTINRMDCSEFSSFRMPSAFGNTRFPNRIKLVSKEDVQVTTLANIWPEIVGGISKPRVFLKLDTQGFDLEVIRGAAENLDHVLGVESELSLKPIYEDMPDYLSALTEFKHHGFEITGFYLVTRDKKSLAAIEYDCVMLRAAVPTASN